MAKIKHILKKKSGRSNGKVTVRHQGGRHKRFLRTIDFKRDKHDIWGVIESVDYDPNRGANIALVLYEDGDRRYIIAPMGLVSGTKVIASDVAPLEPGNALPLGKIPAGSQIHNIEIIPGKGGQMVKGAGSAAVVQGKEEKYILVKLPSGEIRRFLPQAYATIGQVGNAEKRSEVIRKAGTNRRRGIRPTVRGVAMHPGAHPHGGGEGRSGIGMKYPKRYSGTPAVGRTRRVRRYSNNLIVKRRKAGTHQRII
ncbi:50S ribosomal protein L2 [Candidatus Woesebacteria bacterium RIFCSPHIGHO2_01_FULL_41_10]|uniref:50S ribosomal protein L2 n=1 Tax=Candidatus Woesebacteria bacterium RIFCSPHIGHO2_01_FULL_41_10 TaxID=1802500 RepID=A0A1F7YSP9_9BACT|nr:MAG: 50S ribosomal protein L2 [Candidatus Woesebacteria bacterium RIFCSPHIGHO2_01_FULL_41_10]